MAGEDSHKGPVLGFYEAWNAGTPIAELADRFFCEDVEWHDLDALPDAGVHRGREAVTRMLGDLERIAGRFRTDVESVEDVAGRVVVGFVLSGAGRSSGVPVEGTITHVHWLRGDQVAVVRAYRDRDAAIAAARSPD